MGLASMGAAGGVAGARQGMSLSVGHCQRSMARVLAGQCGRSGMVPTGGSGRVISYFTMKKWYF
jgi:hypothetical protein